LYIAAGHDGNIVANSQTQSPFDDSVATISSVKVRPLLLSIFFDPPRPALAHEFVAGDPKTFELLGTTHISSGDSPNGVNNGQFFKQVF
jgi:hypothetical protein